MKTKMKKRALIVMLSSVLAFTGCGNSKSTTETQQYLDEYQVLKNENDPFFKNYFEYFLPYMNDEQVIEVLKIGNKKDEEIIEDLNEIMRGDKTLGRGIYNAFNARLIFENKFPYYKYRDDYYTYVNTLRTITQNDDAFYSSLFSEDIELFIDCVTENTGIKNRELVSELVLKMDIYYDLLSSKEYEDELIKEKYNERINEIITSLFEAKCRKDETFKKSFYAKVMRKTDCMSKKGYTLYQELIGNEFEFSHTTLKNTYHLMTPNKYLLDEECTIENLENICVENAIENALAKTDQDCEDAYFLMIHLLDFDELSKKGDLTASKIREEMFKELEGYFKSESEFNNFYLSLVYSERVDIEIPYFQMLEDRIKEDGIGDDDYMRYLSLSNFLDEHLTTDYDFSSYEVKMPIKELVNMPKEEARKIMFAEYYSDIFNDDIYTLCLESIKETLGQNDLGYEMIYNPDYKYDWYYNNFYLRNNSISVLSSLVYPKEGIVNGMPIVYYEIPEGYEKGSAVFYFENIENRWITQPVEGFKDTFYDEARDTSVTGFITANESLTEENNKPIRFMEYFQYYKETQEGKVLALEDTNEKTKEQ